MSGQDVEAILRWVLYADLLTCLIAWLFLLRKAEIHPLIALIPFYGLYRCYKLADSGGICIASVLVPLTAALPMAFDAVTSTYSPTGSINSYSFYLLIIRISLILVLIMQIVYCRRLARVFGKNAGYIFGLIFAHPVFLCLLAFGKSKYQCRRGSSGKTVQTVWICPACGGENPAVKAVCPACGGLKPQKIPKWRTFRA